MLIRRERPGDRFTMIANPALEDSRLSFRARGVLAYLLSRPVGWSTSVEALTQAAPEGRDAIRRCMRDLEALGYLERERNRTADGRWRHDHVIRDEPVSTAAVDRAVDTVWTDEP